MAWAEGVDYFASPVASDLGPRSWFSDAKGQRTLIISLGLLQMTLAPIPKDIRRELLQDTPQVDDKKILDEVRKELKILLDIKVCPIHSVLTLYPDAMPQYLINHLDRIERIDLLLENYPNLALAGNAYRGVGLPDCVYSGEKAADRILANKARLEL